MGEESEEAMSALYKGQAAIKVAATNHDHTYPANH